jgi:hypothetical protein
MWKVADVEPVRVMGAEGYPYGFNVTTEDGKPPVTIRIDRNKMVYSRG